MELIWTQMKFVRKMLYNNQLIKLYIIRIVQKQLNISIETNDVCKQIKMKTGFVCEQYHIMETNVDDCKMNTYTKSDIGSESSQQLSVVRFKKSTDKNKMS